MGSNLGNRLDRLRQARDRLRKLSRGGVILQAPIYRSAPVACPNGSPDFYNSVVEISFAGSPRKLLETALRIEKELGRDRSAGPNAPRTIDIDLLYFGDRRIAEHDLALPHPRLTLRRFVLRPLADIRPDLVLPGDSVTIAEHLTNLGDAGPDLVIVQADW